MPVDTNDYLDRIFQLADRLSRPGHTDSPNEEFFKLADIVGEFHEQWRVGDPASPKAIPEYFRAVYEMQIPAPPELFTEDQEMAFRTLAGEVVHLPLYAGVAFGRMRPKARANLRLLTSAIARVANEHKKPEGQRRPLPKHSLHPENIAKMRRVQRVGGGQRLGLVVVRDNKAK